MGNEGFSLLQFIINNQDSIIIQFSGTVSFIFSLVTYATILKRSVLKRKNKYDNSKIIYSTDFFKRDNSKAVKEVFNESIEKAKYKIYGYLDNKDVSDEVFKIANDNLKTIVDTSSWSRSFFQCFYFAAGAYSVKSHSIAMNKFIEIRNMVMNKANNIEHTLVHELLHAASSYRTNDKLGSGFHISGNNGSIGVGINEGYTDYLTNNILNHERGTGYTYEVKVIELLELIVGDDKLLNFYFKSDLYGLVNELSKYQDMDRVKQFILDMDTVTFGRYFNFSKYFGGKINFSEDVDILSPIYDRIKVFLYETYSNKMLKENNDVNLDEDKNFLDLLFSLDDKEYIKRGKKIK